jgi:hypothetical protein
MNRIDSNSDGSQVYLNTGTWTARYALPGPDEITPELIDWLRRPYWSKNPLQDITSFVFAFIRCEEGAPTSANLCAWEGGKHGAYRVLA